MARTPKSKPAQPATADAAPVRTLAQEKSDFTAEGSPPPGQVASTAPELPATPAQAAAPAQPAKAAAKGRRQPPAPAGPARRSSKRSPAAWRGNNG